jgi:ABC-type branched-subunit amino acid transport system substrate-binding protein
MKPRNRMFILFVTLLLWACGPRPIPPPQPVKFHPGDAQFSKAEKRFQKKDYKKALEFYADYLSRFPDGHLAAEALMKTGFIQTVWGKNSEARKIYKRLIEKYPDSLVVPDARVEILRTLFNEGKFKEVIHQSARALEGTVTDIHILKKQMILGDSYFAIDSPLNALGSYLKALTKSDDKKAKKIIDKVESAATKVAPKKIMSLLTQMKDELPIDDMTYRLGMSKFEKKEYEDAVSLLSEFIKKFPRHEKIQQAKITIEEIDKKFIFQRYTIGCLLPLSGHYKIYGNKILKSIELALATFTSQKGHPAIKMIVKDTESDPDKAVLTVKELSKEKVGAIIGPATTHETAIYQAQEERIPIIAFSQKDSIVDIGNYVFRNFITPEMQVETIVSYTIDALGFSRFAILHPDDKYGKTFMALFQDEVLASGGEVVAIESYVPGQTDFAEPIKNLVEFHNEESKHLENKGRRTSFKHTAPIIDFDAIFIPDGPTTSGLILPQLAFYDIVGIQLLGTNLWHSNRLIEMAKQFVQGAILVDGFFGESDKKKVKDFVKLFGETYDEKPGFIEAIAYDTAMMLFQLIGRDDIRSRSELQNQIRTLRDFEGVTGLTSFDNNGNAQKQLHLLKIVGDHFVEFEAETF